MADGEREISPPSVGIDLHYVNSSLEAFYFPPLSLEKA